MSKNSALATLTAQYTDSENEDDTKFHHSESQVSLDFITIGFSIF